MTNIRNFQFTVTAPATNRLETVIAGMTDPNTWAAFNSTWPTVAATQFWAQPNHAGTFLDFTHTGYWDASRKKLFLLGASYGGAIGLVMYNAASDTGASSSAAGWSRKVLTLTGDLPHSYDQTAYNPTLGRLYFTHGLGSPAYTIDVSTATDASQCSLTPADTFGVNVDSSGIEYWPEIDSWVRGDNNGNYYRMTMAGVKSTIFTSSTTNWDYHSSLVRNPVTGTLYRCGGATLYTKAERLAWNGTSITRTSLPDSQGMLVSKTVQMCGDISGNLVVLNTQAPASTAMRVYQEGGTWSPISTTVPAALMKPGLIAGTAIHGVAGKEIFMYFADADGTGQSTVCYLYRYS